jgi:hypothetical protein
MAHYTLIKMTNQIVQHSTSQKDRPFTLDRSKLTRWSFLRMSKWGPFLLNSLIKKP